MKFVTTAFLLAIADDALCYADVMIDAPLAGIPLLNYPQAVMQGVELQKLWTVFTNVYDNTEGETRTQRF